MKSNTADGWIKRQGPTSCCTARRAAAKRYTELMVYMYPSDLNSDILIEVL